MQTVNKSYKRNNKRHTKSIAGMIVYEHNISYCHKGEVM